MNEMEQKTTIEDLIMMSCVAIQPKIAAEVLGMCVSTMRKMIKNETFPYMDCVIKRGNRQYSIVRVKLITHITGESYDEQLQHKKKLVREKSLISFNGIGEK